MIKTIIFDIGNVLTIFSWKAHFASFGFDALTQERLANATVLSDDWKELDLGILTDEEIIDLFVENDPAIEREIRQTLTDAKGLLTRCDYAVPWIKELKAKGFSVLFLSNFSQKILQECSHAMDFLSYIDGGVFSFKINLIKPDPAIYKHLLAQYHLVPSECVFIDDTLANIEAARALGIHGIHFKNLAQAKEELAVLDDGSTTHTYRKADEARIKEAIGCGKIGKFQPIFPTK